jgi:predicted transcriptional regulator
MTQKLVSLLERCGYKRIYSGVLAQLIKSGKGTARELERECDLRQPEVSLAISYFSEKKWITPSPVESETGRGRPTLLYTLIPVETLFLKIQEEQQAHILNIQSTMSELKAAMIPEQKGESQSKKEL